MSETQFSITFGGDKTISIFEKTITAGGVQKKIFELRPTLSTTLSLIGHLDAEGILYLEEILQKLKERQ